jgi:hypothetical protein
MYGEPIRLVRQIKVRGILDQEILALFIVVNDTSFSVVTGEGCTCASLQISASLSDKRITRNYI